MIPVGLGLSAGYQIANSLRFRSSASAYLSRTFGTPTDNKKWTWSGWVKRGVLGSAQTLITGGTDVNNFAYFGFLAGDTLTFQQFDASVQTLSWTSTAVFRDPSAHYHITIQYDSTQATGTNRLSVWVNNVLQAGSYAVGPIAQNTLCRIDTATTHYLGRYFSATNYLDGYLSDVYFIDGQALTPASFGQSDANGVWTPKPYSGTYGTNGFYLKFNDGSNLTNLCLDRSGNANNWTATNVSLTAGATYDWMTDTPTNNYCVGNPLYNDTAAASTWAGGNLNYSANGTGGGSLEGGIAVSSGKWYWECLVTTGSNPGIGVHQAGSVGRYTNAIGYAVDGTKYIAGAITSYGATYTTNDIIAVALDMDGGTVTFYKNNVSQGSITLSSASITLGCPHWGAGGAVNCAGSVNFGQRPFTYTPPSGFKALCSANLPAVPITAPVKHFGVTTYSGNNTNGRTVTDTTNIQFTPDEVWVKQRNGTGNNIVYNSVSAGNLITNATNAEAAASAITSGGLTALVANGFTVGNGSVDINNVNGTGGTYVAWAWKANGAGVTNTAGSITSTVSANTTAGFSIVTYTGTAANATVGHGLGVVPAMIIVKCRSNGTPNWRVWHQSLGSTSSYLGLNQTAAVASSTTVFNSQSSTTFGVGTDSSTNGVQTYVAYCFAEVAGFSKIGSYTGNGSADGPFVYCGFKPRWVMVKRIDAASNWEIVDGVRSASNLITSRLYADLSAVEDTGSAVDFLSNGFKPRTASGGLNVSGGTYIFMAFAENPFGGSNVAPTPAR